MTERRRSKRLRTEEKSRTRDTAPSSAVRSESHDAPQTVIGRTFSSASIESAGAPFTNDDVPTQRDFYALGPFTDDQVSTRSDFYFLELGNEKIKQSQFQDAVNLLEKLQGPTERRQLMLSECYLQLGQILNATRSIDSLGGLMASQDVNPAIVMKLADEYITTENYIRALVLLSCASKLYKEDSVPQKAIEGIRICSSKLSIDVFPKLASGGESLLNIARNVGVEMISDMLAQMRSVPNADRNVEAKNEARCIYNIGRCYTGLENHKKSIEIFEQGISVMRQQYSGDAVKYQIYGDLLYNIGLTYKKLEKFADAKRYLTDAHNAYKNVKNWQSVESEKKYKEQVKNDLEDIESFLSTQ